MKKILNFHVATLLLVIFAAMSFSSCSDDDEDVVLESYIIGNWHSYKAVSYNQGESKTLNISKDGDWSSMYFEFDFENDGTAIFRSWVQDEYGLSHWIQSKCSFAVRGDEVRVKDSEGGIISLFFDSGEKSLYIRTSNNNYGTEITTYLYFRK
jgi:hypothetical protein